ncbi:hypothetical protein D9M70_476340 [compost metagenome]
MRCRACCNRGVGAGDVERAYFLNRLVDLLLSLPHLDLEDALRLHVLEVVGELDHAIGDGKVGLIGSAYLFQRGLVGVRYHQRRIVVGELVEAFDGLADDFFRGLLFEGRQRDQVARKGHARIGKLGFERAGKRDTRQPGGGDLVVALVHHLDAAERRDG